MNPQETQQELEKLKRDIASLSSEFYRNNFSARQDSNKYTNFTSRLKVPNYAVVPTTCEVGEIIEVSGKLRICSSANTWTVVGTQT